MKRRTFLAVVPVAAAWPQPAAMTDDEVRRHLAAMRVAQRGHMNVNPAEGEYFYNLVRKMNARRVLEIGTSNGYSAIWFALGLRQTGGRLMTIEIDGGRYHLAEANFRVTGLASLIDARLADAKSEAERLQGPFDVVFLDASKPDYLAYYECVLPRVRKGGIILAHNVVSSARELGPFLDRIHSDRAVKTHIIRICPEGLSVSTKQ
jgi:predicted O-methyltransferase YrrM